VFLDKNAYIRVNWMMPNMPSELSLNDPSDSWPFCARFQYLICLLTIALLAALGAKTAAGQNPYPSGHTYGQKQNSCIVESTSKDGNVVYANSCSYKIHLVWARGNQRWDNYLSGGEVHDTYNKGPFSYYACEMGYTTVDENDRSLNHETDKWACIKY